MGCVMCASVTWTHVRWVLPAEPRSAGALRRAGRTPGELLQFIAEEVRELLAELGFRTLDEAIGHVEMLDTKKAVTTGRLRVWTSVRFCIDQMFRKALACAN